MEKIKKLLELLDSEEYQAISLHDQSNYLNEIKEFVKKDIVPELNINEQVKTENDNLDYLCKVLMKSRNILRSLFDNLPDLIYVVDRNYKITAVNMALSKHFNRQPQTIVGKKCYQILNNLDTPCQNCQILGTLQSGNLICRNRRERKGSNEFSEWEVNTYPIFDESGEVSQIIIVERDITEKHKMEIMLSQSEKMAALGLLTSGIAHEINNPLSVIMANTQILLREIPAEQDWHEMLQRIFSASERSKDIVKNLLDFVRRDNLEREPTDIKSSISKSLDLIRYTSSDYETKINFRCDPDLPNISASIVNIQSVWVNIIMNALDAVDPDKGKVIIDAFQEGNDIVVKISDNGKGIPANRLHQIFDPFYTTKDPGKGTGLGLSVCHRIVKQHGGQIEVDSIEGEGTVFNIRLPI